jgi:hypothetical protein
LGEGTGAYVLGLDETKSWELSRFRTIGCSVQIHGIRLQLIFVAKVEFVDHVGVIGVIIQYLAIHFIFLSHLVLNVCNVILQLCNFVLY